ILLDVTTPMTPVARMLNFTTPVTGTLNVAPGQDSSIIGVLRNASEEQEVQGYGIRVPEFAPTLPVVAVLPSGAGLGTPGQDQSIIAVLRCRTAGGDSVGG